MPIKNPRDYPDDWAEIRDRILDRAGNRCECNSECGKHHPEANGRCSRKNGQPIPFNMNGKLTVLTIAHLDHNAAGGDHSDENLKAMCQGCHLRYDGWDRRAKDEAARAVGRLF